jgi:hypothetical protein
VLKINIGNTDGEFLNGSTTHTNIEQGAWWQVDLGSKKNIHTFSLFSKLKKISVTFEDSNFTI